jgi:hypothetical protein
LKKGAFDRQEYVGRRMQEEVGGKRQASNRQEA